MRRYRVQDFTGHRFGRLTVLSEAPRKDPKRRMVRCQCDCGKECSTGLDGLKSGATLSCGCYARERIGNQRRTHGHASQRRHTQAYGAWQAMIQRCRNQNCPNYPNYGGRGITVCERWLSFENFLEDMGEPAAGQSLDRIDNATGHYEKSNCRWTDWVTQASNTRHNRYLTHTGITDTISGWGRRAGLTHSCIQNRLERGWSVARTLTEPVKLPERRLPETLTHAGITDTVPGWSKRRGWKQHVLKNRLKRGWSVERALTTGIDGERIHEPPKTSDPALLQPSLFPEDEEWQ